MYIYIYICILYIYVCVCVCVLDPFHLQWVNKLYRKYKPVQDHTERTSADMELRNYPKT